MLAGSIFTLLGLSAATLSSAVTAKAAPGSILRTDPGVYGEVEEYHYFYNQWPIGLSVLANGRTFVCYTRGDYAYTLGEVTNKTTEAAYPNEELNTPLGGLATSINGYLFGSNSTDHFINVQALYTDPLGRLWVLDTGRPRIGTTLAYASPGGPKLVRMDTDSNKIAKAYTFPVNVHFPDSYMNDVRFDLTKGSNGIAYIVDSSDEGRTGFIILDLGTGKSWRRLNEHPSTLRTYNSVPSYVGKPFYEITMGQDYIHNKEGLDGIALSADGNYVYYAPLTSNYLYRVPTAVLRVESGVNAEQKASNAVENLGQKGSETNGFETDSNGLIYMSAPEQNAIFVYDHETGRSLPFVRDPRILWADSLAIGFDGYIYMTINQLYFQPLWNNGTDYRQYPGAILRAKLSNNGTKATAGLK